VHTYRNQEKTIGQPIRAAAKSTHVAEVRTNLEGIRDKATPHVSLPARVNCHKLKDREEVKIIAIAGPYMSKSRTPKNRAVFITHSRGTHVTTALKAGDPLPGPNVIGGS
jgi:hypothetical protein